MITRISIFTITIIFLIISITLVSNAQNNYQATDHYILDYNELLVPEYDFNINDHVIDGYTYDDFLNFTSSGTQYIFVDSPSLIVDTSLHYYTFNNISTIAPDQPFDVLLVYRETNNTFASDFIIDFIEIGSYFYNSLNQVAYTRTNQNTTYENNVTIDTIINDIDNDNIMLIDSLTTFSRFNYANNTTTTSNGTGSVGATTPTYYYYEASGGGTNGAGFVYYDINININDIMNEDLRIRYNIEGFYGQLDIYLLYDGMPQDVYNTWQVLSDNYWSLQDMEYIDFYLNNGYDPFIPNNLFMDYNGRIFSIPNVVFNTYTDRQKEQLLIETDDLHYSYVWATYDKTLINANDYTQQLVTTTQTLVEPFNLINDLYDFFERLATATGNFFDFIFS